MTSKKEKKIAAGTPAKVFPVKKFNKWLVIILLCFVLLLALYVRLSFIYFIGPSNPEIGWDGIRYDWIAVNLLNHAGYGYYPDKPDAWRPPGYPFFLFASYFLLGHYFSVIRFIQCILGAGTCLILFLLAKRLASSLPYVNYIALLAALLYALNFYSIWFTGILYTELFTSFLIILSLYLFCLANDKPTISFLTLFSIGTIILWYAVLTRPATILFWGWIFVWLIIENHKKIKKIVQACFVIIIGFCIVILPWTIRNYKLYNKFLLISSNGGLLFFMAYHPLSKGEFIQENVRYTPEQDNAFKGLDVIARDKLHYRYALEFIRKNPRRALVELPLIKQKLLWTRVETKRLFFGFLPRSRIPLVTFHFISLFALLGFIAIRKNIKEFFLPMAYIINHSLVISLFYIYNGSRVRLAMVPMLALFASVGIVRIVAWFRK